MFGRLSPETHPTTFVGRVKELAEIGALLLDPACRLLTLVGPGGIGKTRLAVEAASAQIGAFPDGVFLVPLQSLSSPEFIVPTIAAALNFQFSGQLDPQQQLLIYLTDKSLLLVLDNFEHLLGGAVAVSEILTVAPGVKILTTSREPLNLQQEWLYRVEGMPFPAVESFDPGAYSAVQLFVNCARRAQAAFSLEDEAAYVARICQLVEGMPLALELAASWLRRLPCGEIVREIERGLDILESLARNVEPRHHSMRATLDHSWNLLSDPERAVFMKLSVFRGGFRRKAAEEVADATLATLSALVDKSMLQIDSTGRYGLHELLRQYGEEQLKANEQTEAARDLLSAYFAAFLHQKWGRFRTDPEHGVNTLAEIEIEFENVRAAWQTMVDKRKTAELSMAIYGLSWFLILRGRYPEALALFKQADDALQPVGVHEAIDRVIGQLRVERSCYCGYMARAEEGKLLAQDGLTILQRVGSLEDLVMAWRSLCLTYMWLDEHLLLKQAAEQAVMAARRIDDPWLLGRSLWFAAAAALELDLDEAGRLGHEGLEIAQASADSHMRALFAGVLGNIAHRLGDYAEARRWFELGLQGYTQASMAEGIVQSHIALGSIGTYMQDYPAAVYHYQQSLKLLADHEGLIILQLFTLLSIADLWVAHEQRPRAVELVMLVLHHPATNPPDRAAAQQRLAQLQAEVSLDVFAAAQERGRQLQLNRVTAEILAEFSQPAQPRTAARAVDRLSATKSQPFHPPAADKLTARELEILRFLAAGLSNRDIADELYLALNTVKWYISQIYSKLHVSSRTQALARAHELNLLA